ncbi:hypothetical protein EJ110_NYTH19191 [Nymphaea thermarum]|nr:hypothetical protein EJ110_NYTH19191 [Nymphaea thermarum]
MVAVFSIVAFSSTRSSVLNSLSLEAYNQLDCSFFTAVAAGISAADTVPATGIVSATGIFLPPTVRFSFYRRSPVFFCRPPSLSAYRFRHLPPLSWALGFSPLPPIAAVLGARVSAAACACLCLLPPLGARVSAVFIVARRRINVAVFRPFFFVFFLMADSSSSSSVHTNVPDVGSTRTDNVPVQVTTIQLNKENYLRWSAVITEGIAGRGRIAYVNGRKVEPVEGSIAWDTWYLEDNQVKMWVINSVSSEIQPLILRKKTAMDMWVILEHMYGQKKRKVRVYQLMRDVYSLRQGTRSVAEFYAALKSKWEDLDYHSDLTW